MSILKYPLIKLKNYQSQLMENYFHLDLRILINQDKHGIYMLNVHNKLIKKNANLCNNH
jgi:hypothetical protein